MRGKGGGGGHDPHEASPGSSSSVTNRRQDKISSETDSRSFSRKELACETRGKVLDNGVLFSCAVKNAMSNRPNLLAVTLFSVGFHKSFVESYALSNVKATTI